VKKVKLWKVRTTCEKPTPSLSMYFLFALGSFKVTIIYIIIHSIIFLININGVVKEFNNGVINGDFLINGP